MIECPLCHHSHAATAAIIKSEVSGKRDFYFCNWCFLIFVTDEGKLNYAEEKKRYLMHQNSKDDDDYVDFLCRAINPSLRFLKEGMQGLDYGCGHEPVLAFLLRQRGYECSVYDPFFFPELKKMPYDFIFSTEVVEHFFNPAKEFERIDQLLAPRGYLIIMTSFWKELTQFSNWYYKNDPAHVVFYDYKTFQFIAKKLNYEIVYTDFEKVIIFQKS